ncbi:hypothetical protein FACS189493_0800 [Spirochaetia bacterium]|nr:hypothetical protein FACS189493_0800 [Spirochaetia bacterium]
MSAPDLLVSQRLLYLRPQVNLARSTTGRMWIVGICAGLTIVQSAITDSYASLFIALAAVAAAGVTEFLITRKHGLTTLKDGSAIASALVLALLLPNGINPVFAALGAVFAMAVVKYSFGGLGANWVNPALGGWLFVRFSWPAAFTNALESSHLSVLSRALAQGFRDTEGSPLGILNANGFDITGTHVLRLLTASSSVSGKAGAVIQGIGSFEVALMTFLNNTVFAFIGAQLPGEYVALFMFSGPGIIADRGVFALLFGTILLTAFQVIRVWTPLVFVMVYSLLIRLFGGIALGGAFGSGDVLFGLCSGGALAAAFLLAADPATGPKSRVGSVFIAALAGVFAFLFRYIGLEPYGAFFAVALINALVPLVRDWESRGRYRKGGAR